MVYVVLIQCLPQTATFRFENFSEQIFVFFFFLTRNYVVFAGSREDLQWPDTLDILILTGGEGGGELRSALFRSTLLFSDMKLQQ